VLESAATMRRTAANAAMEARAESHPPRLREATKPDLLTVAAITIAATVIGDFIHEGPWSRRHVPTACIDKYERRLENR
jgi:hypothetical protein